WTNHLTEWSEKPKTPDQNWPGGMKSHIFGILARR
ncbi:MAG: hypothetical protein ACI95S_002689, partial [Dinoroseobacter sp.]